MHSWFTVYNPKTKEACEIYVVGSAIDGFLEKDSELIRAFFFKNAGYSMIISSTDELIDQIHNEGATILNSLTTVQKEKYVEEVYR